MHAPEPTLTALDIADTDADDGIVAIDLDDLPAAVAPPVDAPAVDCLDILTLERQFIEQGYRLGAPAHVTPRTLALDRAAAREAGCPECGCRDVVLDPYHRGGNFRYAASCPACFAEWEG
jgi:hypothetical protein